MSYYGDLGPSVGTFARLKQENRDLKAEVERLKKDILALEEGLYHDKVKIDALEELQVAAEAIEGPASWFDPALLTPIKNLHRAIRKVKGM